MPSLKRSPEFVFATWVAVVVVVVFWGCNEGVSAVSIRTIGYYDNEDSAVTTPPIGEWQQRRICAELCMSGLGGEPCGRDVCAPLTPFSLPYSKSTPSTTNSANSSNTKAAQNKHQSAFGTHHVLTNNDTSHVVQPPTKIRVTAKHNNNNNQKTNSIDESDLTRRSACSILCQNHLGEPLCGCGNAPASFLFRVNFSAICDHFCQEYSHKLYGCGVCVRKTPRIPPRRGDLQHLQMDGMYKQVDNTGSSAGVVAAGGSGGGGGGGSAEEEIDWKAWCVDMCRVGNGGAACSCDLLPMAMEIP